MSNHKLGRVLLMLALAALLPNWLNAQFGNLKLEVPKPSEKKTLAIGDIDPALSKIPVVFEGVVYEQIGEQAYDEFYKNAAKLNGLNLFSVKMCDQATTQLKNYARSKYADAELKKSIDELTNNTPPEEWTTEQAIAVERLAKEKNKVSSDETKYFLTMGGSLVLVSGSLVKGGQAAGAMVTKGSDLLKNATSLPGSKVLAATSATKTCIENLNSYQSNVPTLIKQINALATGFQSI